MRERHIYEFEVRDGDRQEYLMASYQATVRESELGFVPKGYRQIKRKATGVVHWRHIYERRGS